MFAGKKKAQPTISEENVGVYTWQPHANTIVENFLDYVRRQASRPAYSKSAVLSSLDWSGKVVLDAGCGAGAKALPMALRGAKVFGIDGSPVQVQRARVHAETLGLDNTVFMCGFLEDLAQIHQDNELPQPDLIINTANIHHVAGWREVIAQFSEVLKPGGFLYITFKDPTLAWASFLIKNQIAYRLGWSAESRMRVGKFLFGWWDKRRNVMNLNWDSFYADLYSAYYIPIMTAGLMKKHLERNGLAVIESFPPIDVRQWIAMSNQPGLRNAISRILDRAPWSARPLNWSLRLRYFVRPREGPRIFVCKKDLEAHWG